MGYCGECLHRNAEGNCQSEKLIEDWCGAKQDQNSGDMLIYPYAEGGWFWVGEKFGCVHFESK